MALPAFIVDFMSFVAFVAFILFMVRAVGGLSTVRVGGGLTAITRAWLWQNSNGMPEPIIAYQLLLATDSACEKKKGLRNQFGIAPSQD